jgi:hypothetical protein
VVNHSAQNVIGDSAEAAMGITAAWWEQPWEMAKYFLIGALASVVAMAAVLGALELVRWQRARRRHRTKRD